jgi:hypothetical protein
MYIDSYAIIVQKDMDGGDSLHRVAMYAFALGLRQRLAMSENPELSLPTAPVTPTGMPGTSPTMPLMSLSASASKPSARSLASSTNPLEPFEVKPGIYVRHPDPTKWYSNPDTTSRDQLFPVIAYCAVSEDHARLWRLFKAVAARGFFAQNTLRIGEGKRNGRSRIRCI